MQKGCSSLTLEEKLDLFFERNAISEAQYDKSLGGLIEITGIKENG